MAKDKYSTKYVLLEHNSLDSILSPLKGTQRIKYTCIDVSQNFIIFGATSGGIYIFNRDPCHFLQLLPNKDGSLNNVSISPDEKFIGFSTARGIAVVLERSDEGGAYLISRSDEHGGANITSLTWSESSNQMYIADDCGQLSVMNISLFINKSIFQLPSHIIIKLDSEIFQVSCCGELLLVSTRTRCYVCDTVKEQYKQIGTKLREGVFGASFIKCSDGVVKAFCARPGSRLWEVDTNGSVLCTHQFKEALTLTPSVTISLPDNKIYVCEVPQWQEQSVNFPYLIPVMDKYLFTFKQDCLYVFDPEKVELIIQCNKYSNVVDARCIANTIYTWNSKGMIKEFILTPVENCLLNLYFRQDYSLCIELCEQFVGYIESLDYDKLIMLSPLLGLSDRIDNLHLNNNLNTFFVNLNNCCNIHSFKINLNDSLEQNFKVPKVCDKSNSIFCNNSLISQSSNNLVFDGSCFCKNKAIDCVHENYGDKKNNFITYLDNNLHNKFLVDNNLGAYVSSELSSDITLVSLSPQDIYSSLVETNKSMNGKMNNGTKTFMNKWQIFEDKFNPLKKTNLEKTGNHYSDHKDLTSLNLSDSNESIVVGHTSKEKKVLEIPAVDFSAIINICDILSKSDNNCKLDLFAQLLQQLFLIYNDYRNLLINDFKSQTVKSFPLNKYLPSDYVEIVKQSFYFLVKSGDMTKCLHLLPNEILKSPLVPIKYPNLLLAHHSYSDLEIDIVFSSVLFMLLDILDPFTILQTIDSLSFPCSFISWNLILQTFQENTFDYITVPQESYKFNDWPLPVILNIIFLMLRLDQVESACYISKEIGINVKHISYLLLRLQLQLESNGILLEECQTQCNVLFLKYISSLLGDGFDLFKDIDHEIINHIEKAMVGVSNLIMCCNCDFPIQGKKTDNFNNVGMLLLSFYTDYKASDSKNLKEYDTKEDEIEANSVASSDSSSENVNQFSLDHSLKKVLCEEAVNKIINLVKVIPNVIIELIQLQYCEFNKILDFIAQFNLINSVDSIINNLSAQEWIVFCESYKELSQGLCCICHQPSSSPPSEVDWNSLAIAMLQSIGPTLSITILSEYSKYITPGKLHLSFYRMALLSDLIMLQTFEGSSSKDIMSTYHGQFIKAPMDSHLSQIGIVSMWEADSSDGLLPSVVHSKDRKHWGITLDVNSDVCSKCSLVLNSTQLLKDGIRGFKCGHTYHVLCLRLCNSLFQCSICS